MSDPRKYRRLAIQLRAVGHDVHRLAEMIDLAAMHVDDTDADVVQAGLDALSSEVEINIGTLQVVKEELSE